MFTLDDVKARCTDERELLRGRAKVDSGDLKFLRFEGDQPKKMVAECAGSDGSTYSVAVDERLDGACDCRAWIMSRQRCWCKHMAAAAIRWLESNGPRLTTDRLDKDLGAALRKLTVADCKTLLAEAAGGSEQMRDRIIGYRRPRE